MRDKTGELRKSCKTTVCHKNCISMGTAAGPSVDLREVFPNKTDMIHFSLNPYDGAIFKAFASNIFINNCMQGGNTLG